MCLVGEVVVGECLMIIVVDGLMFDVIFVDDVVGKVVEW